MDYTQTNNAFGKVDIYLIDQILKNRYAKTDIILDAGCGAGRNLKWFYTNGYNISGIDADITQVENAKVIYSKSVDNFKIGSLEALPYNNNQFHHIICNAVLHFAKNDNHFNMMFDELIRVLKPNGTLFIRIASDIGLDGNTPFLKEKRTNRVGTYFLTREKIKQLMENYNIELIEPVKTTNVADKRAMTTLVFCKL